ncbi:MAG: universal stress protein [Bacteroidales bacterium]|nr:universal stress protein [Bacteroidales bacterium]
MKKILVAVDFSDLAALLIEHAASQALAFGSEVLILYVEPPVPAFIGTEMSPPVTIESSPNESTRIKEELDSMRKYLENKGIKASFEYLQGSVVNTIVETLVEFEADLLIIGAHSHGILYRAFIGSISSEVMKVSPCPVLLIREN